MQGQSIVFLVLVTSKLTLPVGFEYHEEDIDYKKWKKEDQQKRKDGVRKEDRPKHTKPKKPTKVAIAATLVNRFVEIFPDFKIRAVCADCLYGNKNFSNALNVNANCQIISQIRTNQKVIFQNKKIDLQELFCRYPPIKQTVNIRGEQKIVHAYGVRTKVKAYGKKMYVIALKYEGEEEYRYLTAENLTWRYNDIISAYSLRWLVEVFIQDWKGHLGYHNMATQQGEDGAYKSMFLSLLADHSLYMQKDQAALINSKSPAATTGSLINYVKAKHLVSSISDVLNSDNPKVQLSKINEGIDKCFKLMYSKKHMHNFDMNTLNEQKHLQKYKKAA